MKPSNEEHRLLEQLVWRINDACRGVLEPEVSIDIFSAVLLLKHFSVEEHRYQINDTIQLGYFDKIFEQKDSANIIHEIKECLLAIRNKLDDVELADFIATALSQHAQTHPQKNSAVAAMIEATQTWASSENSLSLGTLFDHYVDSIESYSKSDKGLLVTPREVRNLIIELLQPQSFESIYDPSCGSGGFISATYDHIQSYIDLMPESTFFGQDENRLNCFRSALSMALRGSRNHLITAGDFAKNPAYIDEKNSLIKFDVVSTAWSFGNYIWDSSEAEADKYGQFAYGIPPGSRGDCAKLLHMLASLKENSGRMALVTTLGVLHRVGPERDIRENLIMNNKLDAVIALPPKLFRNNANSSVIIICRNNKVDDNVMFIDASTDYAAGKAQNRLHAAGIRTIVESYKARCREEEKTYLATPEEIAEKDYSLNVSLYIKDRNKKPQHDLGQLADERARIQRQLNIASSEVDRLIQELLGNADQ